tara:strand:- start:318 stop:536 length:219 start_codon:yes stop_codon:yes gene_type:complete
MSLADAMPEKLVPPLGVDVLLEQLDDKDSEVLRGWLCDSSFSVGRIVDALETNGTPITGNPIRLWRKRNVVS